MKLSIKFSSIILVIGLALTMGQTDDPSQQPEDIAAYGLNYTDPNKTAYIPHIDSERYAQLEQRFHDTKKRIRREIANGLRASFPRIRSLVTYFADEEGFVRNGIVFCGAEHDHSKLDINDLGGDDMLKVRQNDPGNEGAENLFPLPSEFSIETGSLSLIDGWSVQNETYINATNGKTSIQCGLNDCLEGSFVSILARFVRSHGYYIQHRDICSAFAETPPEIEARTCNFEHQPVPRKAFECSRNTSTNNKDWWQVNKQCYGLGEEDCTGRCKYDVYERYCRASEEFMEGLKTKSGADACKVKEGENIKASEFINEVWRVLGYSVNGEVDAIPSTNKALVTGGSVNATDDLTECRNPRTFIHAINGNAQINAFRDLGIEEAAAAWFEEIKGVRSYLQALQKLLRSFYETSLQMFPFIENEEIMEECPMGEVEHDPNTESGDKIQPLCQRLDFQTSDKLNKVKEAGQAMIRSQCFCRNGDMDDRFKEVNWATGDIYDPDWLNATYDKVYAPCDFVAKTGGVKCKNGDGTNNSLTTCESFVGSYKCQSRDGFLQNDACDAMDGTNADKTPKDFLECQKLAEGEGYNKYDLHEFDQIYLEVHPNAYGSSNTDGPTMGSFTYTDVDRVEQTRDIGNCLRYRDRLPSVYTYCTQIKAWGDTEVWNRHLERLKPDKNRIKMRKNSPAELKTQIIQALMDTLPPIENTCGRAITAYAADEDTGELQSQLTGNKGGNCMPFEKLHEIIYRLEFETGKADNAIVHNATLTYLEQEADETTDLIFSDMFCDTRYSYTNSKFPFRQMSYMWDHIQGGSRTDASISSGQDKIEYRPDGANSVPFDYFKYETTGASWPVNQRYAMEDRSFCFIDWIGAFSGSTTRYDAYGSEYVDPYLLYSREIDEAVWNTAIAISSKKQVVIDNLELWDVFEDQLTNPEDGNILTSLAHAATAHFMTVQTTDYDDKSHDAGYEDFFNQN